MNENGKTINHTNLMNFVLQTKGVFYFLNRNSTGDLAQLTYFFGLSKVKGWTTHTTTYEIQKKKNRTINCNQPKVFVQTKLLKC